MESLKSEYKKIIDSITVDCYNKFDEDNGVIHFWKDDYPEGTDVKVISADFEKVESQIRKITNCIYNDCWFITGWGVTLFLNHEWEEEEE